MSNLLIFFFGMFVGALAGFLILGLLTMAGRGSRREEAMDRALAGEADEQD